MQAHRIKVSRRDLAHATSDVVRHFSSAGALGFRVGVAAEDVTAASIEHRGPHGLELRIQADGRCSLNFCLEGEGEIDDTFGLRRYCPDRVAVYDGGSQTLMVPPGASLFSVGLSGTSVALADFLSLSVAELTSILGRGGTSGYGAFPVKTDRARQLRRSATRMAESLAPVASDRLGRTRVKAGSMDFGLQVLETLEQAHCAVRDSGWVVPDSVSRRLQFAAQELGGVAGGRKSIDSIAAGLGFSRSSFDQAFRARYGCSPGAFRIDSRLRHVAWALKSSDTSVTTLAMEFEFSSSSNLTRCFRAHYGLNPSQYRDRHRRRAKVQGDDGVSVACEPDGHEIARK